MVTEVWWNNLWLAEGFATLWERTASEILRPQFQVMKNFWYTMEETTALAAAGSGSGHPLTASAGAVSTL